MVFLAFPIGTYATNDNWVQQPKAHKQQPVNHLVAGSIPAQAAISVRKKQTLRPFLKALAN
jgi:hypothetical protein